MGHVRKTGLGRIGLFYYLFITWILHFLSWDLRAAYTWSPCGLPGSHFMFSNRTACFVGFHIIHSLGIMCFQLLLFAVDGSIWTCKSVLDQGNCKEKKGSCWNMEHIWNIVSILGSDRIKGGWIDSLIKHMKLPNYTAIAIWVNKLSMLSQGWSQPWGIIFRKP